MALSAKHKLFVEQYLLTNNATEAYDRVYHPRNRDSAASNGYKLLRNAEISEAIKHRLSETTMLADEVLMRLAAQARGNMNDFVRFNDNGDPLFDLQSAATFGKLGLVKKLKIKTRTYATVEVADQASAHESDEIEDGDSSNTGAPGGLPVELGGVVETTVEFELYSSQAALKLLAQHHGLLDKRGSEEEPVHNVEWTVEQWKAEQEKRRKEAAKTMDLFDDEPNGDE